ncbi:capsular assembly complex, KDO transferase KpsC (double domain) [Campylobacter novaezeelandiae]|uniref:capsular polysaccharide biosynthesis protein n=1 Tax=Campylobacter novaezeelandiae TaxID=2267891 RepID=UPI001C1DEDDC|nr:capsular polysaccharide biosynthesis protein [Campylobacter novaezeelandiae]QWU80591.1 capsular assembly complex, KDO transferase KpsC (double domain) [Campylobacter novaezeelandiae]
MNLYSTSKRLIKNVKNFYKIKLYSFFNMKDNSIFLGWGRKKSGLKAISLAKKHKGSFLLLEDGFIRSLNLGLYNSPSFSIVEDDVGIYYDSNEASRLENLLNNHTFDSLLLQKAKKAIALIQKYEITKYNNTLEIPKNFFKKHEKRVLIITQVDKDASLKYGQALSFSTNDMIQDAINENKDAKIYIKIHPDVLSGKRKSDFDLNLLPENCELISKNYNPIALLKYFSKVYTKTSTMGFEALMVGCKCVCYGLPFYAGWGLTIDKLVCQRRKAKRTLEEVFAASYLLYPRYFNPYLNQKSDIFDTIYTLNRYKNIEKINSKRLFFLGFALWKRRFIKPFFAAQTNKIIFVNSIKALFKFNITKEDKFFIWGYKFKKEELRKYFKENQIYFVEDGFIRSITLGSDLTRAFSLVVDSKSFYVDPSKESDLENILQNYEFDENLIQRARNLIEKLKVNKISKYNGLKHQELFLKVDKNQKVILIPAQVEDDVSMILGGMGFNTKDLIKEVRLKNPKAYIIFKPHPDVLSGNRKGLKDERIILEFCDEIIKDVSIDSAINVSDEIHTITSTSGFDALLRGKKVFTYGLPFYAGWGLTQDKHNITRRTRKLSIEELVAATLIIYPRYINPTNKHLCEIEVTLDIMQKMQNIYFSKWWIKLGIDIRIFIIRKIRRIFEKIID